MSLVHNIWGPSDYQWSLDPLKVTSTAEYQYTCPSLEFELYCDLNNNGNYEVCLGAGNPGTLADPGEWFQIDNGDLKIVNANNIDPGDSWGYNQDFIKINYLQLRANHLGFASNVGTLDFEVTLIDDCAIASLTIPPNFFPTSITYQIGDPAII